MRSRDGGFSWKYQESGTTETLNNVYFSSVRNGFIVGNNATLIVTTDAGLQWKSMDIGYESIATLDLFGIHYFPPTQVITVVGEQGIFISSTDGGDNWVLSQLPASCFVPQSTRCAANTSLGPSPGSKSLLSVKFFDSVNGVVVGDSPNILITSDGGVTFEILTPIDTALYPQVTFAALAQDPVLPVPPPSSSPNRRDP